jgi:hypothetical protein
MSKTISVKVPEDMAEEIEQYKEEIGERTSGAVRRLIREGLKREEDKGIQASLPMLAFTLGFGLTLAAFGEVDPVLGYVGMAAIAASLLYDRLGLLDRFT